MQIIFEKPHKTVGQNFEYNPCCQKYNRWSCKVWNNYIYMFDCIDIDTVLWQDLELVYSLPTQAPKSSNCQIFRALILNWVNLLIMLANLYTTIIPSGSHTLNFNTNLQLSLNLSELSDSYMISAINSSLIQITNKRSCYWPNDAIIFQKWCTQTVWELN